ncbi:MAG: peptide chain release factor N(5)-glutamine methyltransferase [Chloroflexi bacterium]|nr:peptide chain release factor N(5)-glutamine methyltransferase [Chloroflexota bacterium]
MYPNTTLDKIRQRLKPFSESHSLDAQVLLAHILNKPRTWVLAHPETQLSDLQQKQMDAAIAQLESNIPLPYVLGHWEFYGLDFNISPATLIPRPETELLIDQALDWLITHPEARLGADVGTGSGCIAITLAKHMPNLTFTATDISPEALEIARINAKNHHVERQIAFVQSNLLNGQRATFDIICANLPYIPTATLHTLEVFGREPTLALDGGADGLDLIRTLVLDGRTQLAPGGLMLLEIDSSQGKAAHSLAQEVFSGADVRIISDLSGRDRLMRIELAPSE